MEQGQERFKQNSLEAAFKLKQAEERLKRAEEKLNLKHRKAAERQFFSIAGAYLFEPLILKQICDELGPLLFEFVNQNLTPAQESNVIRVIRRVLGNDLKTCNDLLAVLGFDRTARSFKCETGWLKTKTMSPYKESFDQYTQLAMSFELKDPELESIVDNILDPVKFIFRNGTFLKPDSVHHYSAIIGHHLWVKLNLVLFWLEFTRSSISTFSLNEKVLKTFTVVLAVILRKF
jgi:hypothetical protein